ncbi:TPR repeat-containing protein ZIP4 [Cucumis melo var. makuwa]|uniref:TPR repeat-containing protein ZIP4 n=1 Tax=Cucumis melo var. makuwa TaxID=1194695 RepID=A0A5A7SWE5_CUCMM|nr:TPR repeat-containing protein ZIP4 [Cucumis melo var. makuwa]TYJ96662.1 TPR repeat-containing protein ZIP4 [Cucumis melo var. makuwa]
MKVLRDGDYGDNHPSLRVLAIKAWLGLGMSHPALKVAYCNPMGACCLNLQCLPHRVTNIERPELADIYFLTSFLKLGTSSRVTMLNASLGDQRKLLPRQLTLIASLAFSPYTYSFHEKYSMVKNLFVQYSVAGSLSHWHGWVSTVKTYFDPVGGGEAETTMRMFMKLWGVAILIKLRNTSTRLKRYNKPSKEAEVILVLKLFKSLSDIIMLFFLFYAARACHSLCFPKVASLSSLLNFYSTGKPMPAGEVILLRTLVTILTQESIHDSEILRVMKRAYDRAIELGVGCFFSEGEVEFMLFASKFYMALANEEQVEEYNVLVFRSLIMTITAMIVSEQ